MDDSHPILYSYPAGTILEEYWENPHDPDYGHTYILEILEEANVFIEVEFFNGEKWCPPVIEGWADINGINSTAKFIDHGIKQF